MMKVTKNIIVWVAISGLAILAGSCAMEKQTRELPQHPNVIYILADDLGYGDLSCYGQKYFETPHIDRIAENGVRFTQHYAGSTICAPSRSVLMTGKHTGNTTIRGNFSQVSGERIALQADDFTIPQLMKQAGYVTGAAGKWGLGELNTTGSPDKKGVDEWLGFLNQRNAHFYYPSFVISNTDTLFIPENEQQRRGQYVHDLFADFALDFIQRQQDTSFFLYLPFTIPHAELLVPEDDLSTFRGLFPEEGHGALPQHYGYQTHYNAAVAAMITRMDRDVGRILDLLIALGISENTLVVFSSDNGPADFLNGYLQSSGGLRGAKRDLYEGGIRVPFVAQWPARIPPNTISHHISAFEDLFPTLSDIVGLAAPEDLDGISFLPALLGVEQHQQPRDFLYWEFHERGFSQAVRFGPWKALLFHQTGILELYNLETDEREQVDLADQYPELVYQARQYFISARSRSPDWPGVKQILN